MQGKVRVIAIFITTLVEFDEDQIELESLALNPKLGWNLNN